MASSIIGQLRVILGIDTAQFDKGLDDSQKSMLKAGRNYERLGKRVEGIGKSMSVALSLPLTAIAGGALKMASDFESAMNRVEAATGASGAELKSLRDQAKAFGAEKGVTATAAQTADVMEALAKNGLNTTQILGGATEATLRLAAANNAQFAPSADLVTDIMQQFGKKAADTTAIVDKLTGGMLVSKFGFEDYRLALGQVGGVAGGLGLSFEDTNTALAATASLFASGSDAGTSFKTFLTSLNPKSKDAAAVMKQLGIDFFDASGKMKPLAEIAQILKDKLGGLADQAKTKALTEIFGTDAMRTAVGLMNQGADGIARINGEINKASAQQQMDARMKGLSGALVQLRKMAEAAAIAFGDSGLLAAGTRLISMLGDLLQMFGKLPEPVQTGILALVALTAASGPVIALGGKLISVWGALLQSGTRLAAMMAGTAAAEVAVGVGAAGAVGGVTALGTALSFLASPWGIAIAAVAAAIGLIAFHAAQATPATDAAAKKIAELRGESAKAQGAIEQVGKKIETTGDKVESAVKHLQDATAALYGIEAGAAAAARGLAQINLAKAQAGLKTVQTDDDRTMFAKMMGVKPGQSRFHKAREAAAQKLVDQAKADFDNAGKAETSAIARAKARQAAIAVGGGTAPTVTLDNPDIATGGGGRQKKDRTARLLARRQEMELQVQMQAAQERGDLAEAQALEDKLNLTRQISDYEETGLSKAAARTAAERDLKAIQDARAKANAKAIADEQTSLQLDVAQIQQNAKLEDTLRRQQELEARIQFYKEKGLSTDKATTQAKADQLKVDQARADIQKRMLEDAEQNRQLELARARGDNAGDIRAMEQKIAIRDRARDIERDSNLAPGEGIGQATAEAMDGERARLQGVFRDTMKDGFRAALSGDLKGFVKNFWQNAIMDAAENALNSLADGLLNALRGGKGGGIGGALGGLFKAGASLFGGGGFTMPGVDTDALQASIGQTKLHGFKAGGSFKVGGMSGVDRNVVKFRASKGEMVDIRKPGDDRGPGGDSYHFSGNLMTPEFWAMINRGDAIAAQRGAAGGSALAQTELRKRGRQRLGR